MNWLRGAPQWHWGAVHWGAVHWGAVKNVFGTNLPRFQFKNES